MRKSIINRELLVEDNNMSQVIYLKNPMGGTLSVFFSDKKAVVVAYNLSSVEMCVDGEVVEVRRYGKKGDRRE